MYNRGWYFKYAPTQEAVFSATESNSYTKPPVKDVASEFAHKSLEELAIALKYAPDTMALHRTLFAVMDERTSKDKSVVLCNAAVDGTESLDWVRCSAKNASLFLRGQSMSCGSWDELKMPTERWGREVTDRID